MRYLYKILCIVLIIAMTACGSSKNTTSAPSSSLYSDNDTTYLLLKHLGNATSKYKNWEDVVIPLEMALSQPKNLTISGRATMIKDKSLFISIRALGFEVATLYANTDSIYASYKLNKIYIAEDIKKFLTNYPITIGNLQDLLLGRAFMLGKGTMAYEMNKEMKLSLGKDLWTASPHCDIQGVQYAFLFGNNSDELAMLMIDFNNKSQATCCYNPATTTVAGNVSNRVDLSTSLKSIPLKASISWDIENAKWNTGATIKWKAPKGYRRIDANSLLKAF